MSSHILNRSALLRTLKLLRRKGKRIVTTNGSFDLLHIGHTRFLERARRQGDVLIALLNSDASIRKRKGRNRPILPQQTRAEMMAALRSVDYVTIFDDDTPLALLRQIKPDIHVKGGSWEADRIAAEKNLVESWGGKLRLLPMIGRYSTTRLIDAISRRTPAEVSGPTTAPGVGRVPPRGAARPK